MRFGILSQWFDPEPGPAALPGVLARGLRDRGHDVRVPTGFPNYPTGTIAAGYRQRRRLDENIDGVAVRRVALYPSHDGSTGRRLANYASFSASATVSGMGAFQGVDALWVYNSPITVSLPTWAARLTMRIPAVVHVMDLWPDTVLASGIATGGINSTMVTSVLNPWCRGIYRSAHSIAYISPGVGTALQQRGVPAEKLHFVPLWADEEIFRPSKNDRRPEWRIATALLASCDIAFIGLRPHPLSEITMPSKTQAALAAGLAILVAAAGDVARVAADSGAGWSVRPGDVAAIAEVIRMACAAGRAGLADLGRNGKTYYERTYSVDRGVRQIESLLIEAARSGPGRTITRNAAPASPLPTPHPAQSTRAAPATRRRLAKRSMDLLLVSVLSVVLAVPAALLAILVQLTSPGPVLFWSDRIGRDNVAFRMPKFRSMRVGSPQVATHLMADPAAHLTRAGRLLRRTSLDEIPQLWSILKGDMSFVGPRPALFNQADLIELRTAAGVHHLAPGLTGWAQIRGRDELPIPQKVALDSEYARRQSLGFDARILLITLGKVAGGAGIVH